ncbi:hypothetical protein [Caballeronia sordidicola]|uniref:hypothetical protein n=1 Tax=Caballeronia sordidicola TaxID=196367 RepID=UPI0004D024F1|nr:hypothetical protein [Caballeronia sordidicola]
MRMIQIGPNVAFAAVVLSPEWNGIATGDFRPAPAQVGSSARVVAPSTARTTNPTHEIEQLGLI